MRRSRGGRPVGPVVLGAVVALGVVFGSSAAHASTASTASTAHATPGAADQRDDGVVQNASFEADLTGGIPPGWFVPDLGDGPIVTVTLVEDGVTDGRRAARLQRPDPDTPGQFGNLFQVIDATGLQDRRVRFSADVVVAGDGAGDMCRPWLRTDRPGNAMGVLVNAPDGPIRAADGRIRIALEADVAADAQRLSIGFMVQGAAAVTVDDVRLEDLGAAQSDGIMDLGGGAGGGLAFSRISGQDTADLSPRGHRNLVALARIIGQLRFFHPADGTRDVAWDDVLVRMIPWIEAAPDDAALLARLRAAVSPLAPGIQLWAGRRDDGPRPGAVPPGNGSVLLEHSGFAGELGGVYRTTRWALPGNGPTAGDRTLPLAAWLPVGFAAETEVADGLFLRLPVHLPTHAGTSIPAATRTMLELPDAAPAPDDRALRLAGVIRTWNALQHFFPYFDVLPDTDWPAELDRALTDAATASSVVDWVAVLERMTAALHDGHVRVTHPAAFPARALRSRLAIVEDALIVLEVAPDDAAAGVAAGDVILALDGRPIDALRAEAARHISGSPQWIDVRTAEWIALRATGPQAELELRGADGAARTVTVSTGPPTSWIGQVEAWRPEPLVELEPGLWYADIGRLDDRTMRAALDDLAAADGIVFDMRGYPSSIGPWYLAHLSDVMLHSASWNIPIVYLPDRRQWEFRVSRWALPPARPRFPANNVWLIDGRSISYAESVSGIIEQYDVGTLVGTPTAGANGNVTVLAVPGGARVSWTGMKVVKHDGSPHHVVGVLPDVVVAPTIAGVRAGTDEVLARGLEIVRAGAAPRDGADGGEAGGAAGAGAGARAGVGAGAGAGPGTQDATAAARTGSGG